MASSPPMQLHPTACRRSHLRLGRMGSHLLNHPNKRLGLPLTKVELTSLDQFEGIRHRGGSPAEETGDWMRAFSEILLAPPAVEILRVD